MSRVKLAAEVRVNKTMSVQERPALYASKCDGCGEVFELGEFCNEQYRGELRGTFSGPTTYDKDRARGNGFTAQVCSFKCAHEVFAEDGWKRIREYKPEVKAGCVLARAELMMTAERKTEEEIRADWEKITHETNQPLIRWG